MQSISRDEVLAELPSSVQRANIVIFLFGLMLVVNAFVHAIRFGLWLSFIQSFAFLMVAVWIGGSLLIKKPRAWWIAVLASGLVLIRYSVGLMAWFAMHAEGRVLDVQRPIFCAAALVMSALSFVFLMRPGSRAYHQQTGQASRL